jgi:Domain of unknown function (DUF427)
MLYYTIHYWLESIIDLRSLYNRENRSHNASSNYHDQRVITRPEARLSYTNMTSLKGIAKHMLDNGPRKMVPTSRRVRVLFNNSYIVDTTEAIHVWEHDYFPQYYIPVTELNNCTWQSQEDIKTKDGSLGASIVSIKVPGPKSVDEKTTDRAIVFSSTAGQLSGLVKLEFNSMGMHKFPPPQSPTID